MRESLIERYLVKRAKELGGDAEKFVSPAQRSVPDRIVTFPKGVIAFVEVKASGMKALPAQRRDHEKRRAKGFKVYVVNSIADVNSLLARLYWLSK